VQLAGEVLDGGSPRHFGGGKRTHDEAFAGTEPPAKPSAQANPHKHGPPAKRARLELGDSGVGQGESATAPVTPWTAATIASSGACRSSADASDDAVGAESADEATTAAVSMLMLPTSTTGISSAAVAASRPSSGSAGRCTEEVS